MLTFSQSLQIAALVLGAVMVCLGLGFWAGHKSAHSRPRLGGFLGFLAIVGFAFGPLAILAATVKWSMTACLSTVAAWLVISGMAWGVVMHHYGKGLRGSFNVSFLRRMYLVGIGVVVSGLFLSQLLHTPAASAEDVQLWGRQVGVFSIAAMIYGAFGLLVFWMHRWSRSTAAQATPLPAEEQFVEDQSAGEAVLPPASPARDVRDDQPKPVVPVMPAARSSRQDAAAAGPVDGAVPASDRDQQSLSGSGSADSGSAAGKDSAPLGAGESAEGNHTPDTPADSEEGPRTRLILRDGQGKLSE